MDALYLKVCPAATVYGIWPMVHGEFYMVPVRIYSLGVNIISNKAAAVFGFLYYLVQGLAVNLDWVTLPAFYFSLATWATD